MNEEDQAAGSASTAPTANNPGAPSHARDNRLRALRVRVVIERSERVPTGYEPFEREVKEGELFTGPVHKT